MSEHSLIEWTDSTWNPLTGCSKCSAGCQFCYAIRTAWRLQHNPNPKIAARYAGLVEKRADGTLNWTGKINLCPELLRQPMEWTQPRRIFVNSQSDLFHDAVPDKFIDRVFAVMAACPQHTFQILTKRAERMRDYLCLDEREAIIETAGEKLAEENGWCHAHQGETWPLPNVWLGVSVENQKAADERIPLLLSIPARVRFLSCEPLLGPVDFRKVPGFNKAGSAGVEMLRSFWVIAGGESGSGARPMHPDWPRSLRDQCAAAGVPFLFKQWGEWLPAKILDAGQFQVSTPVEHPGPHKPEFFHWRDSIPSDENISARVGKKAAGRLLDGVEHSGFPNN